jgi:catechol 2,3-dioxygenase-like lactoylglutathione lyase family enzyme
MSDLRPPVAIGHVRLHCKDLEAARMFYLALGMRLCMSFPGVHVLELRGGTHLLLVQSPDEMMEILDPTFDLIVDDINAFREHLSTLGIAGTDITFHQLIGHHRFFVTDPDGRRIAIHSSHTEGRSV